MANVQPPAELKELLKDSYDAIGSHYNKWAAKHTELRLKYAAIADSLLPKPTVLGTPSALVGIELGCGSNSYLKPASFRKIIANEMSTTMSSQGRELHNGPVFPASQTSAALEAPESFVWAVGDMMTIDLPPQSVDAVVAFYSIIHLPQDEQKELIRRISHWLKPGGIFCANFSAEVTEGTEIKNWFGLEKGWMFWAGWGAEETLNIVKENELEVLQGNVEGDDVRAQFLWVVARNPEA